MRERKRDRDKEGDIKRNNKHSVREHMLEGQKDEIVFLCVLERTCQ